MFEKIKALFQKDQYDVFLGLIDESGMVRSQFMDDCVLTVNLIAYIKNYHSLTVEKAVLHKEIPSLDFYISGLEPLTIVKFSGKQIDFHGQNRILLKKILGTQLHHPELNQVLAQRNEPVYFQSKHFGSLTLDRGIDRFVGRTTWINTMVELNLSNKKNGLNKIETSAIQVWQESQLWNQKFERHIAQELLDIKNENWLEKGQSPISKEDFISQIQLKRISFFEDGDFIACFDDGATFWGHEIHVDGNVNGKINGVELFG